MEKKYGINQILMMRNQALDKKVDYSLLFMGAHRITL